MLFMNEHEIQDVEYRIHDDETPNLAAGVQVLVALVEWANRNSDGWPYWTKPARAAKGLMTLLHDRDYAIRFGHNRDGSPLTDVSEADLKRALAPIKSLLTKQGVDWNADLPWAALLPAA